MFHVAWIYTTYMVLLKTYGAFNPHHKDLLYNMDQTKLINKKTKEVSISEQALELLALPLSSYKLDMHSIPEHRS